MSTRTIIEINHDYLGLDRYWIEDWALFLGELAGTNAKPPIGVRILGQRHHSDPLVVEIAGRKVWNEA